LEGEKVAMGDDVAMKTEFMVAITQLSAEKICQKKSFWLQ